MQNAKTKLVAAIALCVPNKEIRAPQPFRYLLSDAQKVVIGRDRKCQIVIDSSRYKTVSRLHVEIRPLINVEPPTWEICDLNTPNGTYINDKRLEGCRTLYPGDRIALSQRGPEFIYECQSAISPPLVAPQFSVVESAPVEVKQSLEQPEPTTDPQTNFPPDEKNSLSIAEPAAQVVAAPPAVNQPTPAQPEPSSLHLDSHAPSGCQPAAAITATQKSLWELSTEHILTLSGHSGSVRSVAFSLDGKIASGSADKTIKLWNLGTGQEISTLAGHRLSVNAVAFSPDSQTLVSGSADKTIKLWNISTGQEISTLSGHGLSVEAVAFSPDGKTIASSSADKTIKLWNLSTGEEIATLPGHKSAINSLTFSPIPPTPFAKGGAGGILASGSEDKTIKLWNLATGEEMRTIAGYAWQVGAIAISPDGQTFASGSADNTIKMWQL